jgi:Na+/pantothenate symporter
MIITESLTDDMQGLAGAVFNTISLFGTAVGIAADAAISQTVTNLSRTPEKSPPQALMQGYRAAFWASFAMMVTMTLIGGFGLRTTGKIEVPNT